MLVNKNILCLSIFSYIFFYNTIYCKIKDIIDYERMERQQNSTTKILMG